MKALLAIILCGVGAFIAFNIVMDRRDARELAIAQRQDEARERAEAAALLRAKQIKLAKEKELERLRLLAEREAERAKLLAEQKRLEEENRIKTLPARLELAEDEYKQAILNYDPLLQKVEELRPEAAIKEGKMKAAQAIANRFERQLTSSINTKDRAEGQFRTTYRDSGARTRLSEEERKSASKRTLGLIKKAEIAWSFAEKEQIKFEIIKNDLTAAEVTLADALTTLNAKKSILEKTQKEKALEE